MKKLIILITGFVFIFSNTLKSQCVDVLDNNTRTPLGSYVYAYIIGCEDSNYIRESLDASNSNNYPNATRIPTYDGIRSSTAFYNCHGYAWNKVDGGADRWIGYTSGSDADVYMNDGSSYTVAQMNQSDVVFYGPFWGVVSDHSAVTNNPSTGYVLSKWGRGPFMFHHTSHCPYTSSNLIYYKKRTVPTLSGPSTVNQGSIISFTVVNPVPGLSYTWQYSSNLFPVSGSPGSFLAGSKGSASVDILYHYSGIAKRTITIQ